MATNPKFKVSIQLGVDDLGDHDGVWMFGAMARANFINDNPQLYESQTGPYQTIYEEEYQCRWMLAHSCENNLRQGKSITCPYLNDLLKVSHAGFLPEYVWHYLAAPTWSVEHQPKRLPHFLAWAKENLVGHKVLTRGGVEIEDLRPKPDSGATQQLPLDIQNAGGAELATSAKAMFDALNKGDIREAERLADEITNAGRALKKQAGAYYCCFFSHAAIDYFVKDRPDVRVIRVLDWAVAEGMFMKAFILVQFRKFADGIALLDEAIALAPLCARPYIEKGYVLNSLKRVDDALRACSRGWELVTLFPENAKHAGPSLRGLAVALVSLGSLDRAKQILEDSLVIEPGNFYALGELRYIAQIRNK